jgi:hypothetical protein
MSKRSWGTAALKASPLRLAAGVMLAVFLAACSPDAPSAPQATQSLIPATATFTPSPVPPTFTPSSGLTAPGDLAPTPPAQPDSNAGADLLAEDQVAAELAALAQRRIAQERNVPVSRIEIVAVQAFAWPDTSLGCPQDGQVYTPLLVDGYRIVLALGDEEFIFHTDFDRAIPCAAEDERLPES